MASMEQKATIKSNYELKQQNYNSKIKSTPPYTLATWTADLPAFSRSSFTVFSSSFN